MTDIQSATAEIRPGKKKRRRQNKRQGKNTMVCAIPQGDHNKVQLSLTNPRDALHHDKRAANK